MSLHDPVYLTDEGLKNLHQELEHLLVALVEPRNLVPVLPGQCLDVDEAYRHPIVIPGSQLALGAIGVDPVRHVVLQQAERLFAPGCRFL